MSAPQYRLAMTRLAVDGIDYFDVDDREVRRDGPTYTIDTLDELGGDDEITLVLGADAALGLPTWHRAGEVLDRVRLAVLARPGVEEEAVKDAVPVPFHWLDAPLMDVSATDIRQRARDGKSLRFLVRDAVWSYITEHRLYED